jgi:hypothetical protein
VGLKPHANPEKQPAEATTRTNATTEADPCGMTNQKGNRNSKGKGNRNSKGKGNRNSKGKGNCNSKGKATATAKADPYGMTSKKTKATATTKYRDSSLRSE